MDQPSGFYNQHSRTKDSGRCPSCGGAVCREVGERYAHWVSCDWPSIQWRRDAPLSPCRQCGREERYPHRYIITAYIGDRVHRRDDAHTRDDADAMLHRYLGSHWSAGDVNRVVCEDTETAETSEIRPGSGTARAMRTRSRR